MSSPIKISHKKDSFARQDRHPANGMTLKESFSPKKGMYNRNTSFPIKTPKRDGRNANSCLDQLPKIAFWYFHFNSIGGHGKFNWGTSKDEDDYLLDQDNEEQEIRKYEEVSFSLLNTYRWQNLIISYSEVPPSSSNPYWWRGLLVLWLIRRISDVTIPVKLFPNPLKKLYIV